jgi:predicted nicotinamide N-methyase
MAQRRLEGVHLGRPATLPETVVRRIVVDHTAGAGVSEIARQLIAEQIPTARGGIWHPATVRAVLKSTTAERIRQEPTA